MADLTRCNRGELEQAHATLSSRYREFQSRGLGLDMARGKPSPEQLALSGALLELPGRENFTTAGGVDCRNYGGVEGIPEARALFGEYLGVPPEQVIVAGNGSLALMHDALVQAWLYGVPGGEGPWSRLPRVRFLCPSPGYDRHFTLCEHLGVDMLTVDMTGEGPDMDAVARLAGEDPAVRGIWCVPRYSNPTGVVYSERVVRALAQMRTAAPDFRIFWDDAYAVHSLTGEPAPLTHLLDACTAAGQPERALLFGSTSKITLAGAGIAAMAASPANIEDARAHMGVRSIGPDKVNQLRHVRFLRDRSGILEHMRRHAALLRPKFEAVQAVFEAELGGKGVAAWTRPQGGYFVSLDTLEGCAREAVRLAAEAGVKLTPAGASFPYGRDPRDRNIRIAPSFPATEEIRTAMEVVAVCVQLASCKRLLGTGHGA